MVRGKTFLILAAICFAVIPVLETEAFTQFQKDILNIHNQFRKKHHSRPLELDQELCDTAQEMAVKKAERYSKRGNFGPAAQPNLTYHDHIWILEAPTSFKLTAEKVLAGLADEAQRYDFNKPGYQKNAAHFTQIVWASSEELGVANTTLASGKGRSKKYVTVVVLRYAPSGNINDPEAFEENVQRP